MSRQPPPVAVFALITVHPCNVDGARDAELRTDRITRDGAGDPSYMPDPDTAGRNLPSVARAFVERS